MTESELRGLLNKLRPLASDKMTVDVAALRTPQSGHVTRGVRACKCVRCWKKSRCRHLSSFVS
jgi:hypothetical protein